MFQKLVKKSIFGEIMAQNDVKKRQKIDIRPEKKNFQFLFSNFEIRKKLFFLLQSTENWNLKNKFDYHLINRKRLRDF